MNTYLTPTASHKANSRLASQGRKPAPPPRATPRIALVRLEQDAGGNWLVIIGGGGHPMPATDVEAELWQRLQAYETASHPS